ncbi:MAG: DNA/RNA non-specific endonuclease [Allosphingosinicella sp.]|uniref:DNA/RNA non-specific endonuclease n=1 Tax=Allosphingosinicella sp. TaxID=2823234 RepID=UPI003925B32B
MRGYGSIRCIAVAASVATASAPAAAQMGPTEVHSVHCLHSCPVGAPATNDLIFREIYTLSSNDATKMADWVAYRVTRQTIGGGEERRWAADPWLDDEETLEPSDYAGAPQALRIDRGHQAPLASLSGTGLGAETNFLSNITPQGSALNQGPWRLLEDAERAFARRAAEPLYVLTGPLYERDMPPLPRADEPHRVPSHYWKIVATADGRVSAFVMDTFMPRSAPFCATRVAVEEVERRSGLRVFPRLLARGFRPLDAELGCR